MAGCAVRTEICLRYKQTGGFPMLLMVALRSSNGALIGVCLMNLLYGSNLRVTSVPAKQGIEGKFEHDDGRILDLQANGMIKDADKKDVDLVISPLNAVFLVSAVR